MSLLNTGLGVTVISGLAILTVDLVAPSGPKPGIQVNEIIMRADGSVVYDWSALVDGAFYAWSGQVYNADGSLHCGGSGTYRYPVQENTRTDRTADWMVRDDCSGMTPDMEFLFTYTSVNGELADLKYPPNGLGKVVVAIPEEG